MKILENEKLCCGCHACFNSCPKQAIRMQENEEGFLFPLIDPDKCINCKICQNVCPVLHSPENNTKTNAFACQAIDSEERITGSSGGVFAVIAKEALRHGYAVAGAAFTDDFSVKHIIIHNAEDIEKLKGTKYVQSEIGTVYKEIKDLLNNNISVVFSGTPCQTAGLKKFLGKKYDNLLCIDLICHGVPSPKIWKSYLNEVSEGRKITAINFRNKSKEIDYERFIINFSNGDQFAENKNRNTYMNGFIKNLYVRESCFSCRFKGINRCSDITIGDFWSIKEYHPEMYDNLGTSAVVTHTKKGMDFIEKISNQLNITKATTKEIACWNECLLYPTERTDMKDKFYKSINQNNLSEIIEKIINEEQTSTADKVTKKVTLMDKIKKLLS